MTVIAEQQPSLVQVYFWHYRDLSTEALQQLFARWGAQSQPVATHPATLRGKLAARALTGRVLARVLQCAPAELRIVSSASGKPQFESNASAALHFNYAHTDAAVVLAVSALDVGVDIESLQRKLPLARLLAKHFHPDEARAINASIHPEQTALAHWCLKEAYLKLRAEKIAGGRLPELNFVVADEDCAAERAVVAHFATGAHFYLAQCENFQLAIATAASASLRYSDIDLEFFAE